MAIQCEAIFQNGSLRPQDPLALPEGAEVDLIVLKRTDTPTGQTLSAALAEIAAMPLESEDSEFSGANHDQVLYAKPGGRCL